MAASAPEKDYVHQLLQHLTSYNEGIAPESMVENIAEFERHHEGANVLQIFKKEIDFSADIVIIAIGENVSPLLTEEAGAVFRTQFTSLIEALKPPRNASIFVRSSFWPDLVKDRIMKEACESAGGTFIDITAIGENSANRANAERPFKDDGVAIHPGDAGMKAIAEAISDAIWRIA
jgi:lysophospholipase L1-like esterase